MQNELHSGYPQYFGCAVSAQRESNSTMNLCTIFKAFTQNSYSTKICLFSTSNKLRPFSVVTNLARIGAMTREASLTMDYTIT